MTTTPNAGLGGQTPPHPDPSGQTPNPQTQTPNGTQKTSIDTLPPDIQEYIARLRSEAEEANKKSKVEARAKQQAEETRLAEQGEFKKLAEQHETRVKELEPKVEQLTIISAKIRKQIQTATKDWPAEIKAFYPGDDAEVDALQDWYDRSQPILAKLQEQARGTQRGNSPNPPPTGQAGNRADGDKRNREAFVRQRNYGL